MQQFEPLIAMAVAAVDDAEVRQGLKSWLEKWVENGWGNLVVAIQHILDGERDKAILCESLSWQTAAIINAILRRIVGKI
ncbi:MAG: hypothetical protein DRQ49_08085 [Gammaproteobacteria bacterium]|nr:MAG: hypothetical protein DRQ49_08085 [Gammaproteobacteria bacterium]RKZ72316.1 MAG: hypothetical protein DRQ57_17560 [Gammaproteobacteria bacterium]